MEEKLKVLSVTDPLTKLYNRRYFEKKCEEEIERSKRTNRKFSIIMIDLDDFKKVNDTYGHNVGDKVLQALADVIKSRIRRIDIPARWGGEEFVILLPETDVKGAVVVAEDIRKTMENLKLPELERPVTISLGVAEYSSEESVYKLIEKADLMLYKAKRSGKNKVCFSME